MNTRRSLTQSKFIWQYHWVYILQLLLTALFIGANYNSVAIGVASFFGLVFLSIWSITAPVLSIFYAAIWGFVVYSFFAASTLSMPAVAVLAFVGFIVGLGFNITGLAFLSDMSGSPS